MSTKPSDEAYAAARAYLRRLVPSVKNPSEESLTDTARAIEELGLTNQYLNEEHRSTRKRRAYRDQQVSVAQQTHRSEGVDL